MGTPFGDGHMACENRGTSIARMLIARGEAGTRELRELVDTGVVEQTGTRGAATYQLTAATHPDRNKSGGLTANETLILSTVAKTPLSRVDIERATGLPKDQVNYALRGLRQKGRVALIGNLRARNARWAATR